MCFNQSAGGKKRQKAEHQNACNPSSPALFFQMFEQGKISIQTGRILFYHISFLVKVRHLFLDYFIPIKSVHQGRFEGDSMDRQNLFKMVYLFSISD